MERLTGYAAIEYAEQHKLLLNRDAGPEGAAKMGISIEDARQTAEQNPELIWIERPTGKR